MQASGFVPHAGMVVPAGVGSNNNASGGSAAARCASCDRGFEAVLLSANRTVCARCAPGRAKGTLLGRCQPCEARRSSSSSAAVVAPILPGFSL